MRYCCSVSILPFLYNATSNCEASNRVSVCPANLRPRKTCNLVHISSEPDRINNIFDPLPSKSDFRESYSSDSSLAYIAGEIKIFFELNLLV